jgi:putative acetyltransferase
MAITIRREDEKDFRIVEELTRAAFWNLYVPGCNEHFVLHNLRRHADFIPELDFVAEQDGNIAGHIVFSRGIIENLQGIKTPVVSFGPVSVLPELQKQGIGGALIKHTLDIARSMSYPAVCIYGDPRYYGRFGFRCAERYDIQTSDGKFAWALLVLELQPGALANLPGKFVESSAYAVDDSQFAEYERTFPLREKAETESQKVFNIMVCMRY